MLVAEVGSTPIIKIKALDTNTSLSFFYFEMKVVGLSESAMLTDKTPPTSSKQQESYTTEFKEKTSVLLWKVKKKKPTEYESNAWYN